MIISRVIHTKKSLRSKVFLASILCFGDFKIYWLLAHSKAKGVHTLGYVEYMKGEMDMRSIGFAWKAWFCAKLCCCLAIAISGKYRQLTKLWRRLDSTAKTSRTLKATLYLGHSSSKGRERVIKSNRMSLFSLSREHRAVAENWKSYR